MLMGCLYHQLDTLLPPMKPNGINKMVCMCEEDSANNTKVGNQDFLRLEFLSACKVLQDAHTAMRLLPMIPPPLFPSLFQAVIQKGFYSKMKRITITSVIDALVINWPYKTMVVRNLLPPLPALTSKPQIMMLNSVCQKLEKFFGILYTIPETFIRSKSIKMVEMRRPLCSLDITGFNYPISDVQLLESFVKKAYNPNSPPHYERNEIILDTLIDGSAKDQFHALGVVCELSGRHGASLIIKFHKVQILGGPTKYIIPTLKLLAANGTKFLELEMFGAYDEVLESVLCMSESLSGLSLAYNPGLTSFQLLTQLPHLTQLNLSRVNLRGKCEPLAGLTQGLQYLNLMGCQLRSADLQVVTTSKHVLSLSQLDLSENSFGVFEDFYSFCKLCQALTRVSVLGAHNCNLNVVTPDLVALVHTFVNMSNLTFLRITRNDFSSWTVKNHLTGLGKSSTLRCLCLSLPSDVLSGDYSVRHKKVDELHFNVTSILRAANATHLAINWDEKY